MKKLLTVVLTLATMITLLTPATAQAAPKKAPKMTLKVSTLDKYSDEDAAVEDFSKKVTLHEYDPQVVFRTEISNRGTAMAKGSRFYVQLPKVIKAKKTAKVVFTVKAKNAKTAKKVLTVKNDRKEDIRLQFTDGNLSTPDTKSPLTLVPLYRDEDGNYYEGAPEVVYPMMYKNLGGTFLRKSGMKLPGTYQNRKNGNFPVSKKDTPTVVEFRCKVVPVK